MSLPSRKERRKSGIIHGYWLLLLPGILSLISLWTGNLLALLTIGGITLLISFIKISPGLTKLRQLIFLSIFSFLWLLLTLKVMP